MPDPCIQVNEYWTVFKRGPRLYSASRAAGGNVPGLTTPERRTYFSRAALEQDFGALLFDDEKGHKHV